MKNRREDGKAVSITRLMLCKATSLRLRLRVKRSKKQEALRGDVIATAIASKAKQEAGSKASQSFYIAFSNATNGIADIIQLRTLRLAQGKFRRAASKFRRAA